MRRDYCEKSRCFPKAEESLLPTKPFKTRKTDARWCVQNETIKITF